MVRAAITTFFRRCHKYRAEHPECQEEVGTCDKCGYYDDLVEDVIKAVKDALDRRWADVAEEAK